MKRLRKVLAFLLCICIVLANVGYTSAAMPGGTYTEQDAEEEDVATGSDTSYAVISSPEVLLTDSEEDATEQSKDIQESQLLNYLVLLTPNVETPGTQNVLVGLGDGSGLVESAVLHYVNETTGKTYQTSAGYLDHESALFTLDFPDSSYTGKYTITTIEYTISQKKYTIDVAATGISASFGVNTEIKTEPDGVVVEETAEATPDIVISDADGNLITAEDFEDAINNQLASIPSVYSNGNGEIVVVLDPGHGGSDGGATRAWNGVTYRESDITLKIATYCKEELEKYAGFKVYMTRTTDTYVALNDRVPYAKSVNADILVSIHINSTGEGTTAAHGSEVYIPSTNYNAEIHDQANLLAECILDKLVEIGLYDRGVKLRFVDGTDPKYNYADGSLGDYYAINREAKRAGFPGIIVEHAFINNAGDFNTYLGSDAGLKKLGIADAKGIAEYFELTDEVVYEDGDATVAAVKDSTAGSYTLVASGVPNAPNVKFVVTSKENGKTNEYSTIKGAGDSWYANFNVNDFGATGEYTIAAYVVKRNGTSYKVGETKLNVTAASGGKIVTKNINASAGTFDVVISDINSPAGISKIEVPVWSASDLSDIHWYTATKQKDGTYTVHVDIANHNYNYGTYAIQTYVTDGNGVRVNTATKLQALKIATASITAFDADGQKTYFLLANDVPYGSKVTGVRFGVWNEGLNDLHWYYASKEDSGRWLAIMGINDYKKSGTYYVDAYMTLDDGRDYKIGSTSFKVSAPTAKSITVKNVNQSMGTFDVVVSGVSSVSGVSGVRVPVWTASDLSDLYWYNAEKQSDGTYVAHANIKNHKYNYGVYAMQAYVKGNNGIEVETVSNCYNLVEPTPSVSPFNADNESNYILIAENIPRGSQVAGVRFGVWNDGLSDLHWYDAFLDDSGRWLAIVPISDYKKSGTYYADAYVSTSNGSSYKLGGTSFKVKAPSAQGISVTNANSSAGTFDIVVSGATAPSGIASVRVPVWTATDLSDLYWYNAERQSNGDYVVHVNIANHKGNYGIYAMQAYVKANNGIEVIAASNCYYFMQPTDKMYAIMGSSSTTAEKMAAYYRANATYPSFYRDTDAPTLEDFCRIFLEECNAEGVRAEVAFCQSMKETGFLRFGNKVLIEQFNFAGIGATDDGATPATFASVREGIRAQVQHLKAYACDSALNNPCVDPRFSLVTRGTAPYVEWLGINENPYGKGWASAIRYGYSLREDYINKLLKY